MPDVDVVGTVRALSKPIVKLLEVVESGIGAICGPLLLILKAYAEGRAKLVREGFRHQLVMLKTENARAVEQISSQQHLLTAGGSLEVDFSHESEVISSQVMDTYQQSKRRANIVTITAEAADQISDQVSDDPVDPDWVARFFSHAQDVSSEDLQKLWGRVLAGEVERPGTIPLRTLDTLRNLSSSEAQLVIRLASRVSTSAFYIPARKGALSDQEIRILQDAGLLEESAKYIIWNVEANEKKHTPFQEPPGWMVFSYPSGHSIRVEVTHTIYPLYTFRVRPCAYPILTVIEAQTDLGYLNDVVEAINKREQYSATLLEH